MNSKRRFSSPPAGLRARLKSNPRTESDGGRVISDLEWNDWLRLVERKRRLLGRASLARVRPRHNRYFAAATCVSFQLDGIDVTEADVAGALAVGSAGRAFRSRSSLRIRNHVAILRSLEVSVRVGQPLRSAAVVRWYTSISSGLSTTGLDNATMHRLDLVVRRINSPQLRLQPAMKEIAKLHASLIADPLVPSFNGILSRLLLHYHLGRCSLPPVLFDPSLDPAGLADEKFVISRLLRMVDLAFDRMLENGEA